MPDLTYLQPYHDKQLNEIVIPGAHDAGIYTRNRSFVQTQSLDIATQANAGCRFFDLRIATRKVKNGGSTSYEHRAYHLEGKLIGKSKVKNVTGIGSSQSMSKGGGWGDGLENMLRQAAAFVYSNSSEFLILKFSKCFNWATVAKTCIDELGEDQYKGGGNLNNMKCGDLKKKVITVFDDDPKCRAELAPLLADPNVDTSGIMFIKALYDSETGRSKGYDPEYVGMQYFGKFSSTDNVGTNTKKQSKLMDAGSTNAIDCLGMMYWTTTGQVKSLFSSISKRNEDMWSKTNVSALKQTWQAGLETAITTRLGREKDALLATALSGGGALGGRLKAFMPNIVMMDFVDKTKCDTIDALNAIAGISLSRLMIASAPVPLGPQPTPDPTASFTKISDYRR